MSIFYRAVELGNKKLFSFDFDGVLVDSYSCLPEIYKLIARELGLGTEETKKFVHTAIEMEDHYDYLTIYDRFAWWPKLLGMFNIEADDELLLKLYDKYHEERIRLTSILPGAIELLEILKKNGKILVIVAGNDGIKGKKLERIKASGLASYFETIIIVGDDVKTRKEAIKNLIDKYDISPQEIVVIDDKPNPINSVKMYFPEVFAIRIMFKTIIQKAWSGKALADLEIESTQKLYELTKKIFEQRKQ